MTDDIDVANISLEVLMNCVVTYKMLNHNKPLAIKCMEELDRRRQAGDGLNYEDIIEERLKEWQAKVPKPLALKSPWDIVKLLPTKDD